MTCLPKIIHLICDMSLGGVTKNLEIFDNDILRSNFISETVAITSEWKMAPHFDADIIMTHFSPSWANLFFLFSLKKRNPLAKIVHMEHSYSPEWEAHIVTEQYRFRKMLKLSYALFDKIICVSKTQSKWIEAIGAAKSVKHHIINPWSDITPLIKLPPPQFVSDKPLTIGSYGRLVKEKGFEDLIQSFLNMPSPNQNDGQNNNQSRDDMRLIIGGYGPDEARLKELAKGDPRIKFYGMVNDVSDFMENCDIIAVPSYFETFGLVATEGRAAARPILVSPVGALAEQMGNSGHVIDFKNHQKAGQILANLRCLPLVKMSHDGRISCETLQIRRVASWSQFLESILFESQFISRVA